MENVELVRRGYETLDEGGIEAFLDFIHPEFETTTPPSLSAEPDTYSGPEGLRRYFDSFYEVMDEIRFQPRQVVDLGNDRVMAETVLMARGKTTGIEVEQVVFMVWTIRDGLAHRLDSYGSEEEARAGTT